MKSLFRNSFILILFLMAHCTKEPAISKQNVQSFKSNEELLQKYKQYVSQYKNTNPIYSETDLYDLLDHAHNYENTIYKLITHDPTYDPYTAIFLSSQSGYHPNQFDKVLISDILKDILNLDVYTFFAKMEYLKDFIKTEVMDKTEQSYLLSSLEEFKWIKYSVYHNQMQDIDSHEMITNNVESRAHFEDCVIDCMRYKSHQELDDANWIEWTYFLATAAETVAGWFASCAWNCRHYL